MEPETKILEMNWDDKKNKTKQQLNFSVSKNLRPIFFLNVVDHRHEDNFKWFLNRITLWPHTLEDHTPASVVTAVVMMLKWRFHRREISQTPA